MTSFYRSFWHSCLKHFGHVYHCPPSWIEIVSNQRIFGIQDSNYCYNIVIDLLRVPFSGFGKLHHDKLTHIKVNQMNCPQMWTPCLKGLRASLIEILFYFRPRHCNSFSANLFENLDKWSLNDWILEPIAAVNSSLMTLFCIIPHKIYDLIGPFWALSNQNIEWMLKSCPSDTVVYSCMFDVISNIR